MKRTLGLLGLLFISTAVAAEAPVRTTVEHTLEHAAAHAKVPYRILAAVCWVESHHNPKAINKNDKGSPSYGICQVKEATARSLGFHGPTRNLYNTYTNARYAALYLHKQYLRYGKNWAKAISAYNRGHYSKSLTNSEYVHKVIKHLAKPEIYANPQTRADNQREHTKQKPTGHRKTVV